MAEQKQQGQQSQQGQQKGGQQELQPRRAGRAGGAIRPFEEFERIYEGLFPRGWLSPFRMFDMPERMMPSMATPRMPAVDVIDHENEIVIRAEVPGVNKEDLDISMSDHTITIRGRSHEEQKEEKEEYYYHEMSYGEFSRTVSLPTDVDAENAKATCKNGILELTLPKIETAKRKSIRIEG